LDMKHFVGRIDLRRVNSSGSPYVLLNWSIDDDTPN
jgi:hypothetical protein